jgi:hypothetical protein
MLGAVCAVPQMRIRAMAMERMEIRRVILKGLVATRAPPHYGTGTAVLLTTL